MQDCNVDGGGTAISAIYATEGSACFVKKCRIRDCANGCFCEDGASADFVEVAYDAVGFDKIVHKGQPLQQGSDALCPTINKQRMPFDEK